MNRLTKEFIIDKGWECVDPDHMHKTYRKYHKLEILEPGIIWFESLLFMRVRNNYKGGTGLSILGYDVHTLEDEKIRDLEPVPINQYLFKGWIETNEEFEILMKQLRIN